MFPERNSSFPVCLVFTVYRVFLVYLVSLVCLVHLVYLVYEGNRLSTTKCRGLIHQTRIMGVINAAPTETGLFCFVSLAFWFIGFIWFIVLTQQTQETRETQLFGFIEFV